MVLDHMDYSFIEVLLSVAPKSIIDLKTNTFVLITNKQTIAFKSRTALLDFIIKDFSKVLK